MSKEVFNKMANMADLKFSDRYNSMHGIEEFLTIMLDMNATANAAVDRLRR